MSPVTIRAILIKEAISLNAEGRTKPAEALRQLCNTATESELLRFRELIVGAR